MHNTIQCVDTIQCNELIRKERQQQTDCIRFEQMLVILLSFVVVVFLVALSYINTLNCIVIAIAYHLFYIEVAILCNVHRSFLGNERLRICLC